MKDINYFKKVYKSTLKLEKEIDTIWKKSPAIEKLDDKEILSLFNNIIQKGENWWKYTVIGEDKGRIIEEEIAPIFEKNHSLTKNEAIQTIAILSHPKEEAIFTAERKLIGKLALLANKSKNPLKDKKINLIIKKYQKEFFYSKSSFLDRKVMTNEEIIKEALKELKEKGIGNIQKDIKKIDEERKNIKLKQKQLLKKIKPSPEEKKNIFFATMLTQWLDYRKRGMMKQFYYLFSIMHEFSKRKNIPYLSMCSMTADDVRGIISSELKFSTEEAKRREQNVITTHEKGMKTRIFYDEEARQIFEAAKQFHHSNQQIKGTIASLGNEKIITGIARIVIDPAKEDFKEGEILVASMTRIEFVPLMKKAKAIITDEGGIACHAAIVSRELGVPCIIGTKIATKLLKNGDLVEIDTNTGIVRLIK